MYDVVLFTHIGGAFVSLVAISYGIFCAMYPVQAARRVLTALSLTSAFQVFSGVLLAVVAPTISTGALCANLALLLAHSF